MDDTIRIKQYILELNSMMPSHYDTIKDVFIAEYGYPELDPLRDEICKCIICGLYQATITLTNHLLEKSLKFCLAIKYSKENKKENTKIEDAFTDGINKYDKLRLYDTIDQSFIEGLISEEHKNELIKFKNTFRNPYSHANTDIYKDLFVNGKGFTIKDLEGGIEQFMEKCFDSKSDNIIPLKNLPSAQGIFQVKIAKDNCVSYFRSVDRIIRYMLLNLKCK